jgi:hypothetical protein
MDRIIVKMPKSSVARLLPIWLDMSRTGTSGDALIEILDLCEQALAAFDAQEESQIPESRSDQLLLPAPQHPKKDRRGFTLIKGGQYDRSQEAESR